MGLIKHIQLPPLPPPHPLTKEVQFLLLGLLFYSTQLLHLYKAVWWTPQSFNQRGIHAHLISWELGFVVASILAIGLYHSLLLRITGFRRWATFLLIFGTLLIPLNLVSLRRMGLSLTEWGYLMGPLPVFLPALLDEGNFWILPPHYCTTYSFHVIHECEELRRTFNRKLQNCILRGAMLAYYGAFVPWGVGRPPTHYSLHVLTTHLLLAFLYGFTFATSIELGPEVTDAMHKGALHLPHPPPGTLARFHSLFSGASFPRLILGLHLSILVLNLFLLVNSGECHVLIGWGCLFVLGGMMTLKRLGRDFLVVGKLYSAETYLASK